MRTCCLTIALLAAAPAIFGQLESDTFTIQSSRSMIRQPDEVLVSVSVTSSLDATLDQVVASLQGSGITAADLSGVFASAGSQLTTPVPITGSGLLWTFTLGVPVAKLKETFVSLTTLQTSLQKTSGALLTFQAQSISFESTEAQNCSLKDLVADAQEYAQKLAAAAGVFVGPILAISDGSSIGAPSLVQIGVQSAAPVGTLSPLSLVQAILPNPFSCFAEVKFKLIRLH